MISTSSNCAACRVWLSASWQPTNDRLMAGVRQSSREPGKSDPIHGHGGLHARRIVRAFRFFNRISRSVARQVRINNVKLAARHYLRMDDVTLLKATDCGQKMMNALRGRYGKNVLINRREELRIGTLTAIRC